MRGSEIAERFARLDEVDVPNLVPEIEQRARVPRPVRERSPRTLRPLSHVALTLAVLAGIGLGLYALDRAFRPNGGGTRPGATLNQTLIVGLMNDANATTFYAIDPTGAGYRRVGSAPGGGPAAISPDGTKVAFVRYGDENRGVWVAGIDGTDPVRLSEATPNSDAFPTWSPDGERLLFARNTSGHLELFVIDADGSNLTQLTTNTVGQDFTPDWSPDGKLIAFGRNSGGPSDIWVANADGGDAHQLTAFEDQSVGTTDPDWSPDGTRIAFAAKSPDGQDHDIYLIDADGAGLTRLTNDAADERDPTWSPDGDSIVFLRGSEVGPSSDRGQDLIPLSYQLILFNLGTGRERQLQAPDGMEPSLQWTVGMPAGEQTSPSASPSKPFERFFFSASGVRGVLEVNAMPPSICYETQSFPARPIEIVVHPPEGPVAVVASYSPRRGTYCDRSVSEAVARDIIGRPYQYTISWQPSPRADTTTSSLMRQG